MADSYLPLLEKYPGNLHNDEYWLNCLWHSEEKPSLSINVKSGLFYCFGCKEKGSVEKFIAAKEGMGRMTARAYIKDVLGSLPKPGVPGRAAPAFIDPKKLEQYFPVSSALYVQYLKTRGITKKFATLFDLREGSPLSAVWNRRIIYAIRNIQGRIVSLEGRTVVDHNLRYYKEAGSRASLGLFGIERLEPSKKPLLIVEGVFDAISVAMCGRRVVAMCSSSLSSEQLVQLSRVTAHPIVLFDSPRPGTEVERERVHGEISAKLAERFSSYDVVSLKQKNKDPNDLHVAGKLKDTLKRMGL